MIPWLEAAAVLRVFAKGALAHRDLNGWKRAPKDYLTAFNRHCEQYDSGLKRDHDSGEHPLAHVAANALILMWRERNR